MANAKDNSESRQKKSGAIRPLDMFLLGLVRGGLITPYDWQARARVSLGASLPAVRRLLDRDLLRKAVKGPRGRHEFSLTSLGRAELDNLKFYVEDALDHKIGELESVLRLACLATVIGKNEVAKELLSGAAKEHRTRARLARSPAAIPKSVESRLGSLYSTALTRCETKQEYAIADELESLQRDWDKEGKKIFDRSDQRRTRR